MASMSEETDFPTWLGSVAGTGPRPFPAAFTAWLTRFTGGREPLFAEVHLSVVDPRADIGLWSATVVTESAVVLLKRGRASTDGSVIDPHNVDVVAVPLSTAARVSRVHSDAWGTSAAPNAPVKLVVSDREYLLGLGAEYAATEQVWSTGSTEAVITAVHALWCR
jgi:hypothetical protein